MGKLAVCGGDPVRKKPFINWPVHGNEERELILKVIDSGDWWQFAYEGRDSDDLAHVARFQNEFAQYQGAAYGFACANGTAAIEILLKAMGIGPGDEVIVPSYTFVSSATAVLMNNAVPIFADIDPFTYNMDVSTVEGVITDRTRAIMPVHFSGQCCDMDAIGRIAHKYGLQIIEDCAHAHGSEWENVRCGSFGAGGTFSMQASKVITSGEGGAITTNDSSIARLCESYIRLGREKDRPWYEFHRLGWNYRMTEFQGAILGVQLKRLDSQIETRSRNYDYFIRRLGEVEGLEPVRILPKASRHSHHLIMLKYDEKVFNVSRESFVDALNAEGLITSTGYMFPVYKNPMFLNKDFYRHGCPVTCHFYGKSIDYASFENTNPVSEEACRSEALWLNHRMFLGEHSDIDDIITSIKKVCDNIIELRKL